MGTASTSIPDSPPMIIKDAYGIRRPNLEKMNVIIYNKDSWLRHLLSKVQEIMHAVPQSERRTAATWRAHENSRRKILCDFYSRSESNCTISNFDIYSFPVIIRGIIQGSKKSIQKDIPWQFALVKSSFPLRNQDDRLWVEAVERSISKVARKKWTLSALSTCQSSISLRHRRNWTYRRNRYFEIFQTSKHQL